MQIALLGGWWLPRFRFVQWLCLWIDPILDWIGGCACHAQSYAEGRKVVCSRKGCRLQQAYPHAVKAIRAAYDEANLWDSQSLAFDGDSVFWREAQGAVRFVYLAALRKIDFLNHLRWLLARLGEPGVKARCLELWAAAPGAEHQSRVGYIPQPIWGASCLGPGHLGA